MKSEIKEVTVGELKTLVNSGKYNIEIDTPDGFQKIGKWFDKGDLPTVSIKTETKSMICASNHMVQLESYDWYLANELELGDRVITESGIETVVDVQNDVAQQCYDFEVIHPNHRYWSDGFSSHNSGKSYICSGNMTKAAQEQGIFVVLIDSENALDEMWLKDLGVDTSEDKLLKLSMSMIDDVAKTISTFMDEYKELQPNERQKVLFIIDSLGMLLTPTDVNQFDAGDMKGDMGRKAKALKALVTNCVNMFGNYDIGMVMTNHTYASQDMFDPDPKVSGGSGPIFAASVVVAMRKLKLKEDEDGNKTTEVQGIRSACKVVKTRYAKPFESIEVRIPYNTGMNPYSGLLDLFERRNIIVKDGMKLSYVDNDGVVHKHSRKEWEKNYNKCLDLVMKEVQERDDSAPKHNLDTTETTEEEVNE